MLTIAFPVFDPVAIAIGPFAIRWYALAYIGGIVLGWLYARRIIRSERLWGGKAPFTVVEYFPDPDISGFHDPLASHLAMLYAVGGQDLVRAGYAQAVAHGYLWHEFGDSHLILR